MSITNAELASKLVSLINKDTAIRTEHQEWLVGTATGGPNGDGLYPLTDYKGNVYYLASPAKMAEQVNGIINSANGYAGVASAASVSSQESANIATQKALEASQSAQEANEKNTLVSSKVSNVSSLEANTLAFRNTASAAANLALETLDDIETVIDTAKDRATHFGTQAISTVDGLTEALNGFTTAISTLQQTLDAKPGISIGATEATNVNVGHLWVDTALPVTVLKYYTGSGWSLL